MVFGIFKKKKHPTLQELKDNASYLHSLKKEGFPHTHFELPTGKKVHYYIPVINGDNYPRELLGYEKSKEVGIIKRWSTRDSKEFIHGHESEYVRTIEFTKSPFPQMPWDYPENWSHDGWAGVNSYLLEIATKTVSKNRELEWGTNNNKISSHPLSSNTKVYSVKNFYLLERENGHYPVYFLVETGFEYKEQAFKSREERRRELYQKNSK